MLTGFLFKHHWLPTVPGWNVWPNGASVGMHFVPKWSLWDREWYHLVIDGLLTILLCGPVQHCNRMPIVPGRLFWPDGTSVSVHKLPQRGLRGLNRCYLFVRGLFLFLLSWFLFKRYWLLIVPKWVFRSNGTAVRLLGLPERNLRQYCWRFFLFGCLSKFLCSWLLFYWNGMCCVYLRIL